MLRSLSVNGFKSLKSFRVGFSKGLNLLIGPNGSGKTSICQAIGMIAALADNELPTYLLSLGGASSFFTRSCDNRVMRQAKRIRMNCTGIATARVSNNRADNKVKYQYSFTIEKRDTISLARERLSFSVFNEESGRYIPTFLARRESQSSINITVLNKSLLGPVSMNSLSKEDNTTVRFSNKGALVSFLDLLSSLVFHCHIIMHDLRNARVLNIDPHIARQPNDILESPDMLSDGRRLARALSDMPNQRISELNDFLPSICARYERVEPEIQEEIQMHTFSVIDNNGMKCPAISLSDGTIKMIALLAAILKRNHSTAVIEEPENYVHPWACQALVDYLRSRFDSSTCILTTHSETILNCATPREIIIINNATGFTSGQRLKNIASVQKAIRVSGFGCGYHYMTGGLGGMP